MTENEIDKNISKEERRIVRIKAQQEGLRFDLSSTKKALAFWKAEKRKFKKCAKETNERLRKAQNIQ